VTSLSANKANTGVVAMPNWIETNYPLNKEIGVYHLTEEKVKAVVIGYVTYPSPEDDQPVVHGIVVKLTADPSVELKINGASLEKDGSGMILEDL
jgi:hypothetical protein